MENNEVMNMEDEELLVLTDENGNEQSFAYLDVIEYEGTEYLFLTPAESEDMEVVILEIEPVDEETENYLAIEDEALLDTLFDLFKEKFADVLEFEE